MKEEMTIFLSKDDIEELILKIAKEIEHDYQEQEVILIGDLRGSIHFMADLSRALQLHQKIDFIQITKISPNPLHEKHINNKENFHILKDISVNVSHQNVIILEEIIDEGKTLSFVYNHLLESRPASLKIATLLDKPARRATNIQPDYVGQTIEDRYVIGYGMDHRELGRNYSEVYYPKH